MKIYHCLLTCIVLLLCMQPACKDDNDIDCSASLPPPNLFQISISDTAGNHLVGTQYIQEYFELTDGQSEILLRRTNVNYIEIPYTDVVSGRSYYLALDSADQDTLSLNFDQIEGKCYSYDRLNRFTYNSVVYYDRDSTNGNSSGLINVVKN